MVASPETGYLSGDRVARMLCARTESPHYLRGTTPGGNPRLNGLPAMKAPVPRRWNVRNSLLGIQLMNARVFKELNAPRWSVRYPLKGTFPVTKVTQTEEKGGRHEARGS